MRANMRLVVATMLTLAFVAEARAQAAIQEPGAYAFYHPDGDLLHAGIAATPAHANAMAAMSSVEGTPPLRHHRRHTAR
jgi:hypothetical protein